MDKKKTIGCELTHQFFATKRENKESLSQKAVEETAEAARKSFAQFTDFVYKVRSGWTDEKNEKHAPVNLSTDAALKSFYGAESTFEFLQLFGVNPQTDTLEGMARKLTGKESFTLNPSQVMDMLTAQSFHTMYGAQRGDYNPEFAFLLPQVILDAIYLGYAKGGMHLNWIIRTQSTNGQDRATFPYIIMGNGAVGETAEGADAKFTDVEVGQKRPKTTKLMGGIKMTYEVLRSTTLINLADALSYIGEQMAMKADAMAMKVLISGDMADGSESAPVIGVDSAGAFSSKDIKRVIAQMARLSYSSSRMITGLDAGMEIDELPEFKGFSGQTKQFRLPPLGVPQDFTREIFTMPSENQVLLLDPNKAMVKLEETGIMIEQDKNIVNQTVVGVVSMNVGFAIARRNGRVILDKTAAFSTTGFPSYMDVDALLAEFYTH
ncbi:hypothetical protein [Bernardetia sp.]|uniref:hypothetical protein n=1 Tax=Bernardetia sp. TaxID=1937974 RepID=UPI0025C4671F|nr:hypothetical protein [Bernardetia sp.]